jgi:DNA-binding LacI/PurR family transcriptional regulator
MARVIHKKPNIAAVAKLAGVAQSTVSRVLNGGYASERMSERVNRAIRKLGYAPSTAAVNFASGRAGSFGLVLENTEGEWIPPLLSGIEQELGSKRISLLIGSLILNGTYDSACVKRWIDERRVDGLMFVRPGDAESELVTGAQRQNLAVVLIAPDRTWPGCKLVCSTNFDAGRQVAQHLLALGHRNVAFLGGPEPSGDNAARLAGLRDGLAEAGLDIAPANLHYAERYSVDEGRRLAKMWHTLPKQRMPTAVVMGNDAMAIGFMSYVQKSGVRIPEDVSVVGFDDIPAATWINPTLTTARQHCRELGAAACRSLQRQLESPPIDEQPLEEVTMSLIVRESTGPARRR